MSEEKRIALCPSSDLRDASTAVPFDVVYAGQTCLAFAVRFEGQVRAYLNRCSHVAMEMDMQPNEFFDSTRQYLICASHGAMHDPLSGACLGGPCRSGLISIKLSEADGVVHWHTAYNLQPLEF